MICQDPTPLHDPVGLECKTLVFEDKMTFVLCGLSLFKKITTEYSSTSFSLIHLTSTCSQTDILTSLLICDQFRKFLKQNSVLAWLSNLIKCFLTIVNYRKTFLKMTTTLLEEIMRFSYIRLHFKSFSVFLIQ